MPANISECDEIIAMPSQGTNPYGSAIHVDVEWLNVADNTHSRETELITIL